MDYVKKIKSHWRESILLSLLLANILVLILIWQRSPSNELKVYFLDVGQGDAILIETPSQKQILIDGGRNLKVLSLLGRHLPFGDRYIDVVMATHPDADHIGGLPEVLSRYSVGIFLEPGVESENSLDDELHARLEGENISKLLARRGQVINFGDGVRLTILFPDRDVSKWETNEASIVARVDYGESSFLLTGDSPIRVENILLSLDKKFLDTDVLKAGHHGSRTSTSLHFTQAVSPDYAVISAGKGNSYSHPHPEVLNILEKVGVKIVSTIDRGTIEFRTDGEKLELR